jgi:hypothetical protein
MGGYGVRSISHTRYHEELKLAPMSSLLTVEDEDGQSEPG